MIYKGSIIPCVVLYDDLLRPVNMAGVEYLLERSM